ncbi:MAG: cation:proton antiporter, partial [Armatimonadetes bacterium]|nr:cation:proton antiporter [Armatimonadota bacterium]
ATVGVVIAAAITGYGMHRLLGWPIETALVFGTLIAATDPVSVIATFRAAGVKGRLRVLVESESLLNDGTAAVLFVMMLAVVAGATPTIASGVVEYLYTIFGGLICGLAVGLGVLLIAGRTEDPFLEFTLSTVGAYGSFLLAEEFGVLIGVPSVHLSGVIATLTVGIMFGSFGGRMGISKRGMEELEGFWEYLAFAVNSLVFLMIGFSMERVDMLPALGAIGVATLLVLFGRALVIYGLAPVFLKSALRIERRHQHVLFWGGLRGALALALALGLPEDFAFRSQIVTTAFGVVAFSIIVQGLTMGPLLKKLKVLD